MTLTTILIVEDDLATSEFYAELLEWNGYQPQVAATGSEALAAITQRSVQAVLLDRRLPDVDGVALCRQLRATLDDQVPIILLTADYNADLAEAAREAGVSAYLRKPVELEMLLARIAALLPQQREHGG